MQCRALEHSPLQLHIGLQVILNPALIPAEGQLRHPQEQQRQQQQLMLQEVQAYHPICAMLPKRQLYGLHSCCLICIVRKLWSPRSAARLLHGTPSAAHSTMNGNYPAESGQKQRDRDGVLYVKTYLQHNT
jgi:hypothetical protein